MRPWRQSRLSLTDSPCLRVHYPADAQHAARSGRRESGTLVELLFGPRGAGPGHAQQARRAHADRHQHPLDVRLKASLPTSRTRQ